VLPVRVGARSSQARHPTPDLSYEVASGRVVVVASGAVPRRVRSLLMEIACGGFGCVVDRGVVIERCESHPRCCCGELPVRDQSETT
jgi:hypothetical protein